jgi:AraC family transcriptional regulator
LMSEKLETQRSPALAAIDAYVRGFSTQLCSSSKLQWDGVYLEHHRKFTAERSESVSPHHLIALFTSHVSRGEREVAKGRRLPYSCPPGTINLFPAGPIGACRPTHDCSMIVCAIDPKLVEEVGEELDTPLTGDLRGVRNARDHSLGGIIKLLVAEANSGGLSGRLYVEHLAHALAVRFLQLSGEKHAAGVSRERKMPARILQRVLDRMKAGLTSDLDLKTIAAESGYSRSHFLRTFRASVGYSPHQWLMRLRIEEAKASLQKKSSSLTDIALECGFSNHAHFSRTFRQVVGVVPSEYRRNSKRD